MLQKIISDKTLSVMDYVNTDRKKIKRAKFVWVKTNEGDEFLDS
jgi:hypothetical protein